MRGWLVRGEGAIFAIRDAMLLSKTLAELDGDDRSALEKELDSYQRHMTAKGSESIRATRESMENPKAGGPPKGWGYEMRPFPGNPSIKLA